ncbi:MAG: hypothetical protein E7675_03125 [Ruminococcaceae bacterium]|nr:hypothetical protein [Oscillospiraceae bacterium]
MMTHRYLEYLDSLASRGSKPGLERILNALHDLGDPQSKLSAIQVTGTNGKGSYCKMLGSMLSYSNYSTGIFSSPHLEKINECISVNGKEITDSELSLILKDIMPTLETYLLTQFEALTVAAIIHFVNAHVDIAIMEVGMGGAHDATNVFEKNIMSVILSVSLDHTSYLGSSIKEIAVEKSGIMKKGCPVFLASKDKDVIETVMSKAKELDCPVFFNENKAKILTSRDCLSVFSYNGEEYTMNVGADYQVQNAEKALSTFNYLSGMGYAQAPEAAKLALLEFRRPARYEIISKEPYILYDGAHNPDGVTALVRNFNTHFKGEKFDITVGIMADKDVLFICRALSSICRRVYTVTPNNPRAMHSHELCRIFTELGVDAVSCDSFDAVMKEWDQKYPLLCTGSLYSYGDFKKALIKNNIIK